MPLGVKLGDQQRGSSAAAAVPVKTSFPDGPLGQSSRTVALNILCFSVLTFLITLGAGTAVVLSNHSELVNGSRRTRDPISLPLPVPIALAVIGG